MMNNTDNSPSICLDKYQNFNAILFDMDGTIFDSETVHREAWKRTASQFHQTFTDEMYLQFIGVTTPDCMKLALKMFNNEIEIPAFSKAYYQNLETLLAKAVPLKAGFLAYLDLLKTLNKPLGIVTSSAKSGVEANFSHHDFYSDFTVIVTRDDVTEFKPNPTPYLLACQKLAVEPKRVIVFEDSNTGATSAIDAGCFTIGIPDLVSFTPDIAKRLSMEVTSFEALL